MRNANSKRMMFVLLAILVAASVNATAQASPAPQNETIWQKLKKSAKQTGQNAAQQGGQQAQQVQQQVQQQIPIIGGQPNQMNANPQQPCGTLPNGAPGATLNNAAYTTGERRRFLRSAVLQCGPVRRRRHTNDDEPAGLLAHYPHESSVPKPDQSTANHCLPRRIHGYGG